MRRVWEQIGSEMRRELGGIFLMALGLVGYLSLLTGRGWASRDLRQALLAIFGLTAWMVPALVVVAGGLRIWDRPSFTGHRRGWGVLIAIWALMNLTAMVDRPRAGFLGEQSVRLLAAAIGVGGTVVIITVAGVVAALLITGIPFSRAVASVLMGIQRGVGWMGRIARAVAVGLADWLFPVTPGPVAPPATARKTPKRQRKSLPALSGQVTGGSAPMVAPEPAPPKVVVPPPPAGGGYHLPPLSILAGSTITPNRPGRTSPTATERAEVLRSSLEQFGIDVRMGEVSQGPTITRFEIQPPPGVKVSRIVNLADDIALSLAAAGVRIEAPIPGKSAIGIEVPNAEVTPVLLREVLEDRAFANAPSPLTVGLGKDVAGAPVVAALDGMPHLLVAGSTGSGKSVLINVLISSLLFRAKPDQVRLLLIDPKVVELSVYNGIPHLLTPVVTDPKKAAMALKWAVHEMERRYRLFAEAGVRDVLRYNHTVNVDERLYFLVVIIDELADLMMVASSEVEEAIARLAQMARAAGIHLVVATQRPSVDVITGTIKANIPSRIAFAVSSQVDSRTILDTVGADKLLGRGDMLFHPVGSAKAQRLQGAFIGEKEIEAVVEYLRSQAPAESTESFEFEVADEGGGGPPAERDPLFVQAVQLVVESRQASTSMLQRRMRVGYTRAARLIDAMEERGFIGPQDGAKSREVRISQDQFQRLFESPPSPSANG